MKKLKEVVDKQRDEIRAKDRELTLKNEDIEAVSDRFSESITYYVTCLAFPGTPSHEWEGYKFCRLVQSVSPALPVPSSCSSSRTG